MQKWETVFRARHAIEANLIKGHLGTFDIEARTEGEALIGAYAGIPKASEVKVKVLHEAAERARVILEELAARPPGTPWTCSQCNEENGAAFEVCWNCATPAPEAA